MKFHLKNWMYKYINRIKTNKPEMVYKNCKIYQILNNSNSEVYVGSTTQPLCKIMYEHKMCSKYQNCMFYKMMKEIGHDKFYIELIELYPCNSKEELNAREGYFIRERGTLNKAIIGRTPKQWVEDNKEHLKQYKHNYYENNMEHLSNQNKQYTENNKEHIKQHKKQYMDTNKEYFKQHRKQYYETNKDYILEKVMCNICGSQVVRCGISKHQKTTKCKSFVKPIENEE